MFPKPLRPWKTLSREVILRHNKFLTVENHTVQLPEGKIIPDWAWVIIPDAVNVVALTRDRQFVCFRQTKYAVQGTVLAPVGGMLEPGEEPLHGAQRELIEETGYQAPCWISLGSHILEPNRGVATLHFYLALQAEKVSEPHSDDLEDQELLLLSLEETQQALTAGEFKILAWSAVVALALLHLNAHPQLWLPGGCPPAL